ncbi:MAG TPA: ATP-binding protein [Xanthobacteraceae bacterium]|jgi:signal transduction histidine kinase|nr:ATP-binding protein [Xanthobacteraceae bacterium]
MAGRLGKAGPAAGASIVRSRLFIKYVALLIAVVVLALVANGAFEIWFSYQEHKASLIGIQREQAEAAASKIEQFITEINSQVGWTTQLPWSDSTLDQRRFDALRLLRQVPAITELAQIDASGHEQLRVSRLTMDVVGSGIDYSTKPEFTQAVAHKVYYGPVYFRRESEPYMTLSLAGTRRDTGVSIAQVNLKLIWDVVSKIKVGERGRAYVVDADGRLIAHPDISLVLRNTDMSKLAQVRSARAAGSGEEVQEAEDIAGNRVLTAYAQVTPLGWLVFVETPVAEAYAPLYASIQRTGYVLFGALALAFIAGMFLARRMVGPIQALRSGAARIGLGDLSQRISIKTGDEVEALADQFNDMAAKLQESYADLEQKVEDRTHELTRALDQQTATSEILQVISSSPGSLQPVFRAMLKNATRICEAKFGVLSLREGDAFRVVAMHDAPPAYAELREREPVFKPTGHMGDLMAQAIAMKRAVQLADFAEYRNDPLDRAFGATTGARSIILVPMLKENEVIGTSAIFRQEVRPFDEKQVELLTNFAAQAVIAIENTRLLHELQQRTDDLSQSLEELRTAQDRLVQTEKLASLGQLTAGIAHEIKNPLNFVNNFSGVSVELIDDLHEVLSGVQADDKVRAEITELSDTLRDNLQKIVQHGKRADSIVKNMLLHSREGSGEHRPVDINAIVEESLNLAYHGARAEKQGFNITLERSFDPAAGEVDLFPQEITRVLLNLISNGFYAAVKRKSQTANGDFEPVLAAATKNLGDRVEIRIRDNGTGIPPEVKDKMFNPFFTTKPAGEGTGLGLSISHDIIVKQHAGSIAVDTEPGKFTEFKIVLPRKAAAFAKTGGRA